MTGFSFILTPTEIYITGFILLLFIIQLYYVFYIYGRPLRLFAKQTETLTDNVSLSPISVIVYSRGDAMELEKNLPLILNQSYPEFEVIVVNDGEDAESEDVLKILSAQYSNLYYTYVPVDTQYLSHKKLAITMGIKAAKHDIVLLTEANCCPLSADWIKDIAKHYTPNIDIVLGYCAYGSYKGTLQKLIAYDNLNEGLEYLSNALHNHPFSGNGRNLSYRKSIFFAHKGFSKTLNLHAGADSLFINEVATKTNCKVAYSAESITEKDKVSDYLEYKEIKTAQAATRSFFKGNALLKYRFCTLTMFLYLIGSIAGIVLGILTNWLLSVIYGVLLIGYYVSKGIIYRKSSLMLQQKPLIGWLPMLEIALPLFNSYVRFYRLFNGKSDYTSKI